MRMRGGHWHRRRRPRVGGAKWAEVEVRSFVMPDRRLCVVQRLDRGVSWEP